MARADPPARARRGRLAAARLRSRLRAVLPSKVVPPRAVRPRMVRPRVVRPRVVRPRAVRPQAVPPRVVRPRVVPAVATPWLGLEARPPRAANLEGVPAARSSRPAPEARRSIAQRSVATSRLDVASLARHCAVVVHARPDRSTAISYALRATATSPWLTEAQAALPTPGSPAWRDT